MDWYRLKLKCKQLNWKKLWGIKPKFFYMSYTSYQTKNYNKNIIDYFFGQKNVVDFV